MKIFFFLCEVCVNLVSQIKNNGTTSGAQIYIKFKSRANEAVLESTRRLIRPRAASELRRVISAAAALAVHPGVRYLAAAIASGAKLSGGTCMCTHTRSAPAWSMNRPTAAVYSSEAACTLCPLNLPPRATLHPSHAAAHVDARAHTHTTAVQPARARAHSH